jgi:hypothetical protein
MKWEGTLLLLTNNWEIDGAWRVLGEVEERLNRIFNYPRVLLNEPFSDEFERYVVRVSFLLSSHVCLYIQAHVESRIRACAFSLFFSGSPMSFGALRGSRSQGGWTDDTDGE